MKKNISNIAIIFLIAMVLFSSVSFSIEKHLCGGHVFSESMFGNAEKCGMDEGKCELAVNNPSYSKKSCCEEEIQLKKGSIFEKEPVLKLNSQQQNFIVFNLIDTVLFYQKENRAIHFKNYFPPPNTHDFNNLYQVFRI
ncbi:HYC_CC_PP family protein [Tenacibaculum sp.]|uniref:HYC_CC_PP family protein n=1 Tax=Tenacibaculum sp. TaxID=1906242 RepID=UPI003D0CF6CA